MRQSLLLLFASVYYTVENLCVERRKLFDKRQANLSRSFAIPEDHQMSSCAVLVFWARVSELKHAFTPCRQEEAIIADRVVEGTVGRGCERLPVPRVARRLS